MTGTVTGKREISYAGVDGAERLAILDAPAHAFDEPTPLILAPPPANRNVAEFNHAWRHGYSLFDFRERWALNEYSDYDLAASWLLTNRRRG